MESIEIEGTSGMIVQSICLHKKRFDSVAYKLSPLSGCKRPVLGPLRFHVTLVGISKLDKALRPAVARMRPLLHRGINLLLQ